MAINLRAVPVFVIFVGAFAALLKAWQAGDTGPRSALLAMIVATAAGVIAVTFIMIWSGAYESRALPKRLRQWFLSERDQ